MPLVIPLIEAGISALQIIGGLIEGGKAKKQMPEYKYTEDPRLAQTYQLISKLAGGLSPETQANLMDAISRSQSTAMDQTISVSGGQPGVIQSGVSKAQEQARQSYRDVAELSEDYRRKGLAAQAQMAQVLAEMAERGKEMEYETKVKRAEELGKSSQELIGAGMKNIFTMLTEKQQEDLYGKLYGEMTGGEKKTGAGLKTNEMLRKRLGLPDIRGFFPGEKKSFDMNYFTGLPTTEDLSQ